MEGTDIHESSITCMFAAESLKIAAFGTASHENGGGGGLGEASH